MRVACTAWLTWHACHYFHFSTRHLWSSYRHVTTYEFWYRSNYWRGREHSNTVSCKSCRTLHACHNVHYHHSVMFVIHSSQATPVMVCIKITKRPREHQDHDMSIMPFMTCMSWFSWCDLLLTFVINQLCHTTFAICLTNEMAARATKRWHVNHIVQDMHVAIFMLWPAIYVRHAVTSCHTNYCIYLINETAKRAESRKRLDR